MVRSICRGAASACLLIGMSTTPCARDTAITDHPGTAWPGTSTTADGVILLDEISVTGDRPAVPAGPATRLEGDALSRELESTLGETLASQPGVHNSSFGPGVGVPVIRGMSGSRVQILQGSMGSFDASSVSPDHAVSIEPLLAEEIEVHRGPAALRYGGAAMGGAVNVQTRRIPEWLPDGGIDGAVEIRYGTNYDQLAEVFKVDLGEGPLVLHLDGYHRRAGDIRIPDKAMDESAIREQFGSAAQFDNTEGYVPNTDSSAAGGSLGTSVVFDQGFAGVAVHQFKTNYGIPAGAVPPHTHGPGPATPENLRIDMLQTRWEAAAEIHQPAPGLESLSLSAAKVDYHHEELSSGQAHTRFDNLATETRAELEHAIGESWKGSLGFQWSTQQFGATGVESFIPTSDIGTHSFFFIESFRLGEWNLEVGYRQESQKISPHETSRVVAGINVNLPDSVEHTARSFSAALQVALTDQLSFRMAMTQARRNPAIQELLSLGPHFATRSFEIGNPSLQVEDARNLDVALTYRNPGFEFDLNLFRNQVDNYIYQENQGLLYDIDTGFFQFHCVRVTDCLPVYTYYQQDALFTGYEAEVRFPASIVDDLPLDIGIFSDYVHGHFTTPGAGDVPRLPPRRLGMNLSTRWRSLDLNGRWTYAFAQRKPGLNETPTDAYERLDLELSYTESRGDTGEILLFVKANNVTNAEIRQSTSFLRNFAPEPGFGIETGLRWSF